MDAQLINHAFLNNLTVEIYDEYGIVSQGKIVMHTRDIIKLDDGYGGISGFYYEKDKYEIRLQNLPASPHTPK